MITSKRILVIAPHPDDEVLGCGGTLIRAVAKGYKVTVVFLTSGESDQVLREKEAIKACAFLKLGKPIFLRIGVAGLGTSLENINRLTKVFVVSQPDLLFVNHEQDADKDHLMAYKLAMEVYWRYNIDSKQKKIKAILLYEVHKPMQTFNLVENVSGQIDKKMAAMSIYKSQLKTSRIDLAIQGLNRYRGGMHEGINFAEVFQVKRLNSLL